MELPAEPCLYAGVPQVLNSPKFSGFIAGLICVKTLFFSRFSLGMLYVCSSSINFMTSKGYCLFFFELLLLELHIEFEEFSTLYQSKK